MITSAFLEIRRLLHLIHLLHLLLSLLVHQLHFLLNLLFLLLERLLPFPQTLLTLLRRHRWPFRLRSRFLGGLAVLGFVLLRLGHVVLHSVLVHEGHGDGNEVVVGHVALEGQLLVEEGDLLVLQVHSLVGFEHAVEELHLHLHLQKLALVEVERTLVEGEEVGHGHRLGEVGFGLVGVGGRQGGFFSLGFFVVLFGLLDEGGGIGLRLGVFGRGFGLLGVGERLGFFGIVRERRVLRGRRGERSEGGGGFGLGVDGGVEAGFFGEGVKGLSGVILLFNRF